MLRLGQQTDRALRPLLRIADRHLGGTGEDRAEILRLALLLGCAEHLLEHAGTATTIVGETIASSSGRLEMPEENTPLIPYSEPTRAMILA